MPVRKIELRNKCFPKSDMDTIKIYGVAKSIFENEVYLLSDTRMSDEDLGRVVRIMRGLWR